LTSQPKRALIAKRPDSSVQPTQAANEWARSASRFTKRTTTPRSRRSVKHWATGILTPRGPRAPRYRLMRRSPMHSAGAANANVRPVVGGPSPQPSSAYQEHRHPPLRIAPHRVNPPHAHLCEARRDLPCPTRPRGSPSRLIAAAKRTRASITGRYTAHVLLDDH